MAFVEPDAEPVRILPTLRGETRPYWTGGADGELLIQYCGHCDRWTHPPRVECPTCGGPLQPRPVSGTGTLFSFTVGHKQFHPDVPTPYNIAIVELDEQEDLRLITNIIGCELDDLAIGMRVQVVFERHGETYVPLFEPARS